MRGALGDVVVEGGVAFGGVVCGAEVFVEGEEDGVQPWLAHDLKSK
jgi:hypothetical protein